MIYPETDLLHLRGWRDDDLEPFAAMNADENVMEFYRAAYSREQSDAFAERLRIALMDIGSDAPKMFLAGSFWGDGEHWPASIPLTQIDGAVEIDTLPPGQRAITILSVLLFLIH